MNLFVGTSSLENLSRSKCPKVLHDAIDNSDEHMRRIQAAKDRIDVRVESNATFMDSRGYGSWTEELDPTISE